MDAERSYDPIVPAKVGNHRALRGAATVTTGGKGETLRPPEPVTAVQQHPRAGLWTQANVRAGGRFAGSISPVLNCEPSSGPAARAHLGFTSQRCRLGLFSSSLTQSTHAPSISISPSSVMPSAVKKSDSEVVDDDTDVVQSTPTAFSSVDVVS
jgi:hypothetical protein